MKNKKKLVYVASFINFSYGMEWMAENMDKDKYEVHFIFLNKEIPEIYKRLQLKNIQVLFLKYRGKRDLFLTIIRLFYYFIKLRPDIVHAHLFDASLAAITASWLAKVKRRIYSRHHAVFHHELHPHAVKYDLLINRLSSSIIAISENVRDILINLENVPPEKVHLVHHGFDFSKMNASDEIVKALRHNYGLEGFNPVVGVISRFIRGKGLQYLIPAFKKFLISYPDAKLVLANGIGEYKEEVLKLLADIPARNYVIIEFETEIYSLIKCFDVFVHVPVSKEFEAFGQIYIESMRCRVPVICTLSGVANSYIVNNRNALVVPYCDTESIYIRLLEMFENPGLSSALINQAYKDVTERFSIQQMILELEKVYE